MILTSSILETYLTYCQNQKQLSDKTLKAYRIDLSQFHIYSDSIELTTEVLNNYIALLHTQYKPNSVKRKIATLHAFFHYLYVHEILDVNPMNRTQYTFRQTKALPRTISLKHLEPFYQTLYETIDQTLSPYQTFCVLRDIAVFELLLGTGLRISELCHLRYTDMDFHEQHIRILGKGNKERILQIGNTTLFQALLQYKRSRDLIETDHDYFFINKLHHRLSEQSVRNRLVSLCKQTNIKEHITPHMFRHTFATLLLEEDIDIRYIQHILGHSSITTTQIYTHIRSTKQADILNNKNPRNFIKI